MRRISSSLLLALTLLSIASCTGQSASVASAREEPFTQDSTGKYVAPTPAELAANEALLREASPIDLQRIHCVGESQNLILERNYLVNKQVSDEDTYLAGNKILGLAEIQTAPTASDNHIICEYPAADQTHLRAIHIYDESRIVAIYPDKGLADADAKPLYYNIGKDIEVSVSFFDEIDGKVLNDGAAIRYGF